VHYFFTEEDEQTRIRANDVRAALVHAGHRVTHGQPGDAPPRDADAWMTGLGWNTTIPLDPSVVRAVLAFRGCVGVFQLCDGATMAWHRLPPALVARADRFLRNHWPEGHLDTPATVRERLGFMPPMMHLMSGRPGKPLSARGRDAIFYGIRTGVTAPMADGRNSRDVLVRSMRESGLDFDGGLAQHDKPEYVPPPDLVVPRIDEKVHLRRLLDARVCLAPWGNNKLTYRLFEGLASRCLVVAQSVRGATFLDGGLTPGRHYVEVSADLSDLVETVRHYLARPDEAQAIADAGFAHFERCFAARGKLISSWMYDETVRSWGPLHEPAPGRGVVSRLKSAVARRAPGLF
jgi:hypothetical protein